MVVLSGAWALLNFLIRSKKTLFNKLQKERSNQCLQNKCVTCYSMDLQGFGNNLKITTGATVEVLLVKIGSPLLLGFLVNVL